MSTAFFRALARRAARRYEASGRYAHHFAYVKLTRDPIYRRMLDSGLIGSAARVLDLGCGQGLVASVYAAARERHGVGDWPADWPAPGLLRLQGIDLAPRDIERARAAACADAEYTCADIRSAGFGAADAVVLLDVLHYMDFAAQDEVLDRVRSALAGGGVLLLRVADASARLALPHHGGRRPLHDEPARPALRPLSLPHGRGLAAAPGAVGLSRRAAADERGHAVREHPARRALRVKPGMDERSVECVCWRGTCVPC